MDEIQKKAEKFEVQYNQLKQEFKDYIETSKKNEKKKRLEIRSDISKRLLVVADSLTRITGSDNNNSCVLVKDYADNIRKNINAVYDQMLSASDLSSIDPISGEKFDEQKHTAIGLEFGAKYPENTVFKVVRKGYMMENNVIRPAEVIISKNPAPQKVTKPGLWDRFVRYLKPEKVRLSEIEHKINELERIQKENMDRIDKMIQEIMR
ncbi:MAG: nucleotide exchange factor GrpE [Candidatus Methanoperedens sp.]|nr:nucleotide exchange factor GrpE [Candidatus Methanoperedens sp.]